MVGLGMEEAFNQAEEALDAGEVPIGCALVDQDTSEIVAVGRNRTNELRNATRHAELCAIDSLIRRGFGMDDFSRLVLFVTVEPCIMCAAALRLLRVRRVHFGCFNERFGGCGSVMPASTVGLRDWEGLETVHTGGPEGERAVGLLRRFYLRENGRAPNPRKKERRREVQGVASNSLLS